MGADPTHGNFQDILALTPPALKPLLTSLRDLIRSLDEKRVEVAWPNHKTVSFGVGPRKMTEHYAYIAVHGSHINLGFYHGTALADPHCLLEGSGKKLRHIKVGSVADAGVPAVKALLRQAISERKRHADAQ